MFFELYALRIELQFGFLLLVVMSAWRWGAGPEKLCAAALLYMALVDVPYHLVMREPAIWQSVDVGHAFIDLSTALVLVFAALNANRIYPLCLAALQMGSLLGHVGREMSTAILGKAYAILIIAPSYLEIAILATGVYLHHRRRMRFGAYRSWRRYWNR